MTNQSKANDPRYWAKWRHSGACGPGRAYAFFQCNATKKEITEEIPYIRDAVQTHKNLELTVSEIRPDSFFITEDRELYEIAKYSQEANLNYMVQAAAPNLGNEEVADELAGIINQAYQSPLYKEDEKFRGTIMYQENGEYRWRE